MPTRWIPPRVLVFAAALVAPALVAVSARADTIVVGTPSPAVDPSPRALSLPGSVVAYRVYAPVASYAATLDASGSFSLSLPPGPYVFVAHSGGAVPTRSIGYAMVRNRKKHAAHAKPRNVKFRVIVDDAPAGAPATASAPALSEPELRAALAPPTGPVVSVGRIVFVDAQGDPFLVDGREQTCQRAFISGFPFDGAGCGVTLVEDREFGDFEAILAELALRSSKAVRARDRVNRKKSLAALELWAPRYRLQGTVEVSSMETAGPATVRLDLVDLGTGETLGSREYTTTTDSLFSGFQDQAMRDMMRLLCADPLPRVIRGTYSGTSTWDPMGGLTETFSGELSFVLLDPEFYDRLPPLPGSGLYAVYVADAASIDWRISGGSPCSYSGSASRSVAELSGITLDLEVFPARGEERRYTMFAHVGFDVAADVTVTCEDDTFATTWYYGMDISTPVEPDELLRVTAGAFVGSYDDGSQRRSWDLAVIE